jgi:DNA-3-methyladenine glycosylase
MHLQSISNTTTDYGMSFPPTETTFHRESTPESSVFDSFRYRSTTAVTPKQRFKRLAQPISHPPRLKTPRSKSPKLTAKPNPSLSKPNISFEQTELLPHEFFQIDALDLAPRLLGKFLRRDDVVLQITEVMPFPNTTEI